MSNEIEIHGEKYAVGNVNAFDQFFISRKMNPFYADWHESGSFDKALANLKEEDLDAIQRRFLPYVKRFRDDRWAPIYNTTAAKLVFEDIDGVTLMKLLFFVTEIYLRPFFAEAAPQDSGEAPN